jgi:hypothetical protein
MRLTQHIGKIVVAHRIARVAARRLPEQLTRVLEAARRLGYQTEMVKRRRMRRITGKNLTVEALCFRQAPFLVVLECHIERISGHHPGSLLVPERRLIARRIPSMPTWLKRCDRPRTMATCTFFEPPVLRRINCGGGVPPYTSPGMQIG